MAPNAFGTSTGPSSEKMLTSELVVPRSIPMIVMKPPPLPVFYQQTRQLKVGLAAKWRDDAKIDRSGQFLSLRISPAGPMAAWAASRPGSRDGHIRTFRAKRPWRMGQWWLPHVSDAETCRDQCIPAGRGNLFPNKNFPRHCRKNSAKSKILLWNNSLEWWLEERAGQDRPAL